MLIAPLFGTALTLAVATVPLTESIGQAKLTTQDKLAATDQFVRLATQCIVRTVVADRQHGSGADEHLGDLIVDSIPSCLTTVRAMIEAYDRYYGEGKGEAFFMGPYLDALPEAVAAGAKNAMQ